MKKYLFSMGGLSLLMFLLSACDQDQGPSPGWVQHVIGDQKSPIYLCVKDMDGDGDLDVATTTNRHPFRYNSEVAWFRNSGSPAQPWEKVVISSGDWWDSPITNANGIAVDDIDGDGREDVVVGTGQIMQAKGGIYWFKAPEDAAGQWQRFDVEEQVPSSYFKMYTLDVDGDADADILAGGQQEGLALLLNPGAAGEPGAAWQKLFLPAGDHKTGSSLFLDDLDGNGSIDIMNTYMEYTPDIPGNVSWFSLAADNGTLSFARTMVDTDLPSAFDVNCMDVNGDGLKDLLVSTYDNEALYWYEAPAVAGNPWTKHLLSDTFSGTDIATGDIDGDGASDFIISGLLQNRLVWFAFDRASGTWTEHPVDTDELPGDVSLDDIDADGDLDIVLAGMGIDKIVWYENKLNE